MISFSTFTSKPSLGFGEDLIFGLGEFLEFNLNLLGCVPQTSGLDSW